jgi:hypothetical protein
MTHAGLFSGCGTSGASGTASNQLMLTVFVTALHVEFFFLLEQSEL